MDLLLEGTKSCTAQVCVCVGGRLSQNERNFRGLYRRATRCMTRGGGLK